MQYHIEGMDCASCVGKIETALTRMSGVSDVTLNFATEKLELTLASDGATQFSDIEKTIKRLGFDISAITDESIAANSSTQSATEQRWWQTRKGKQVVSLGILMGVAYALSLLFPDYGMRAFAIAVIVGVFPFARKAVALTMTGTPFSIEMLMSVAALGALIIGESEEAAAVVFLFSVGELLEGVAADRARAGIRALASLMHKADSVALLQTRCKSMIWYWYALAIKYLLMALSLKVILALMIHLSLASPYQWQKR